MPREFGRQLRVGAQIQRLLNELLRHEVKDPRLAEVSVSDVDLSGDLGVAKVYYSVLDPEADTQSVAAAFESAKGFLRSRIGGALKLRRVPELRFMLDMSAKRGLELTQLIEDTIHGDETQ